MLGRAVTCKPHPKLSRVGFRVINQTWNRSCGNRRMHLDDERNTPEAGDRSNIAPKIEIKAFKERGIYRVHRTADEKRVSVWSRSYDRSGCAVSALTRLVVDHERLTQSLG